MNEARATVEDAIKRGLIRAAGAPAPSGTPAKSKPKEKTAATTVIPDWLLDAAQKPLPERDIDGGTRSTGAAKW